MSTRQMPAAEVDVHPELVRRLLQAQHPDLAELPLATLANGWDNVIVRAGDELVVRLPRRQLAADLIANELRWLPVVAPRLNLPVPAPLRVGQPGSGYPWMWGISAFLPGEVAALTPPEFGAAAACLAQFLALLHLPAAVDAPRSPWRGIPLAQRQESFADNLQALGGLVDAAAVNRLWTAARETPSWTGPPMWLHGDLHPANIIVADGRISGIIDFGDITAGDPATDLSVVWMLLPPAYHRQFWTAYAEAAQHEVRDDLHERAKGWALALSLAFLAHSSDNPLVARIGQSTLDAVLASSP